MATRQLRTRTVPVKDPTPRPKKGARKPKAGLPPIETSDTPLEVPNDHQVPAPGTVPAPRRTKRGKAPVPEPAIEQDRPDGISEALLEHVPRHGCGGEGQLEVPSVVPADNDHEHRASRPPSRDTQPLPHGISPDPHPASLRSKRSYPRARPRNRDDPRPRNDDAYFMRRPNLDVPNDRGPQDRLGDGVSPSHEEEDVSHAVSNCPSPRDNHPPLDNNPSPIITNSSPDVVNRRAWDALEEAARLGKGIVAAEATLQEILGGRYDYAEWREALQAADGYDPDDTIEDCVQQLLRLKESTLQRIGELPAPIPPPVSPVAASRASRQRKVPRCAQGVELKTRLPAASDDGDLEDDNQDDSSDLYVASEDRDAAVVRAGDDSDDEEMQRDLDANGNASDDDAKPSGKGASKRRRGLSAKARGKQPAAANPAGSIRRAATPLAGEHPVHPSDEHPARPSVENPAPFPGERPASPSGEQPAKRPHKSGAVGQSTVHEIRAISLEYFDKLNDYAAMHDLTESRVYQIAGATRPSLRRENFWNFYQTWFSVHGAKEGYPDVHKYDRDQLLVAATEAYHVRRDPLGDDPTLDDYQRAFPEVVEFIREQGLQKAQQVVTDPVRARQLMRKNCEDGIIWAMRVYSETGLEIFGFMVDDSGDVGHFGGSPSYEEMWQHPSFTLNLEQSQKDIAGMVNTLRMERRRRATVSASDDRIIAQPRPQVDQAWEANEIILQKKYNTGPRNPSESLRDYHRRIVFNSVAKDIARIMFIDYGLPPSAMWTWRTNAMTLFYKFGLELRGWFRGWDHDCPGHPDATRAALNPSVKEWERAANARVAYDKGDDGDEELLRHAVRVVRWDPHIRAKDFRDLADKGLAYDVDDRIILRVNASPLFIEDEEEHRHSKNFEYGSRQRPRDDPAYDSKHANTKKGKKPRKGKKKVPQVDIDLDYQEPHCEPIQSTAAFDELVAAQRHDDSGFDREDAARTPSPPPFSSRPSLSRPLHPTGTPLPRDGSASPLVSRRQELPTVDHISVHSPRMPSPADEVDAQSRAESLPRSELHVASGHMRADGYPAPPHPRPPTNMPTPSPPPAPSRHPLPTRSPSPAPSHHHPPPTSSPPPASSRHHPMQAARAPPSSRLGHPNLPTHDPRAHGNPWASPYPGADHPATHPLPPYGTYGYGGYYPDPYSQPFMPPYPMPMPPPYGLHPMYQHPAAYGNGEAHARYPTQPAPPQATPTLRRHHEGEGDHRHKRRRLEAYPAQEDTSLRVGQSRPNKRKDREAEGD